MGLADHEKELETKHAETIRQEGRCHIFRNFDRSLPKVTPLPLNYLPIDPLVTTDREIISAR
jgi:hypothetical protein